MSLHLNTPPAQEPVTLAAAKAWLRVESGTDEDALIAGLIAAARARAEWHTGRAFITQGWTLWLDHVPACVTLSLPPLQAVTAVTLYGAGDAPCLLDSGRYAVDADGRLRFTAPLPPDLRAHDAAAIAFTAGYGDADAVPSDIRQAILQIVAALYEHRGGEAAPSPAAALALLAPYRAVHL